MYTDWWQNIRVGLFLTRRYIRYASSWTHFLTVFVMTLTFLNLIVVNGILLGLVEGVSIANRANYTGDIFLSTLDQHQYIERSSFLLNTLRSLESVDSLSARYIDYGIVETNYKRDLEERNKSIDQISTEFVGIDPVAEDSVTNLSSLVIEGSYLLPDDEDYVLMGTQQLNEYSPIPFAGLDTVSGVIVGSKVRIKINGVVREMTVKGIVEGKVGPIDRRLYMTDTALRKFIGRFDYNVDEIAVKLRSGTNPERIRSQLMGINAGKYALVRTWDEAQGGFFTDLRTTFSVISGIIGAIGVFVASITIFIVIFTMAIARERYIGILKGIGVRARALEWSYIALALGYAAAGVAAGTLILYFVLVPYFFAHPIRLPFSNGVLFVSATSVLWRATVVFFVTVFAGFLPAYLVVKKNTLNAILGRA